MKELTKQLCEWYKLEKRDLPWRKDHDAYHIWVSEIMLQQTRVEAVKAYYTRFLSVYPDLFALAEADDEMLHKLWEGLGYYSRVRNMKKCALECVEKYGGKLPDTYDGLLTCCGIGSYTAGAIASIAYNEAVCAVDGNVMRVFARLLGDTHDIALSQTKKHFERIVSEYVPKDCPGTFNQAVMELGALICVPNGMPRCNICPLSTMCKAYQDGLLHKLPIKSKKKPRKIEEKTYLVCCCQNQVHLCKRDETGLLASLYEFDSLAQKQTLKQIEAYCTKKRLSCQIIDLGEAKHIFTHLEWHMQGYLIILEKRFDENGVWVNLTELCERYAMPTALSKYRDVLISYLKGENHGTK